MDDAALLDHAASAPADVVTSRAPRRALIVVALVLAVIAALVVTARVATDRAERDSAFAHHQALSIAAFNAMTAVVEKELRKPLAERDVALMASSARVGTDMGTPGSTYGVEFPLVTAQVVRQTPLMIVTSTTITSDGFTDMIMGKYAVSADGQAMSVGSCTKGDSAIGTADADCVAWAAEPAP